MNALQQKCRPKHQVLVLKCYPRTAKGAVDVKPNGSELSYLLFYATSRRSKIQKIGAFLEKKTASDVWRMRIGNVQVTLAILTALVDKSPKDFALVAPCVLKILHLVLRSHDMTMIESSLPTFEAFCDHHDASSLFADHAYLQQYQAIVGSYAQLASSQHQGSDSRPLQMRWRNAGLEAIRCVSSSDALSSLTGRQIDAIVPVILDNLWTDEDSLDVLLDRVHSQDKVEASHRRNSVTSVRQTDGAGDTNPLALSGTALDADKLAEEDLGVLAVQCLKSIFMVPNRAQIHAATTAFLTFVSQKVGQGAAIVNKDDGTGRESGWAVKLYRACARWAPVQDRYVILLAARDTMLKTPLTEGDLAQHLALAGMMQSILRSDVNLIGLSVMDVVVGLLRQIRKLLQLGGSAANDGGSHKEEKADVGDDFGWPPQHGELLGRLEGCIGDLATHVYYADQIVDMVSVLIARLSPCRSESTWSLALGEKTPVNDDETTATGLGGSQSPSQAASSSKALRKSALRVIKRILRVANPRAQAGGSLNLSRNRVPISVWEGSQWLLRDADGLVRKAYVDALVTWLERETTAADAKAQDETAVHRRSSVRGGLEASGGRRAVSLASNRERQPKARQCQFLASVHLAVYNCALHFVDYDSDIALLHNLLARLVLSLGVNAARYGIPMIYRLQEEVQGLELPIHKVRIAALCHGYFWALLDKFNLDSTAPGRAVNNEVVRRRSKGFWVEDVRVPPPSLDMIGRPGQAGPQPSWDMSKLETEELLPFDDRISLVECISTSYYENSLSPPSSPGAHPGRSLSNPMLGPSVTGDSTAQLPNSLREDMLADWSKESAVAALSEGRAESVNGSRTGAPGPSQSRALNASLVNDNSPLPASPYASTHNLRALSTHTPADRLSTLSRLRNASVRSNRSPSASASSRGGIASVDQLKMILSGNASPQTVGIPGIEQDEGDDESMVSYDDCQSEGSFSPTAPAEQATATTGEALAKSISGSLKRPASSWNQTLDGDTKAQGLDDCWANPGLASAVPPVPRLPSGSLPAVPKGSTAVQDFAEKASRRTIGSRGGQSVASRSFKSRHGSNRGIDLDNFLQTIDSRSGEEGLGNMTKPPY
ncbi:hypothetical protein CDD81_7431 [Ophiocordyceps australis]|uniref:Protein EFR3 n=1 Tax=Ophiocordyceps australis TaxID=1399860 RepID=A0A2C5YF91_9HYPO|nr:hypothetical protein CDD81_7431 [Ophiocordyceps australis]